MSCKIKCAEHGSVNIAYVCTHSVQSLVDQVPRGLLYSRDEEASYNGYCDECNRVLESRGGNWDAES